jgi:hypothetical protein
MSAQHTVSKSADAFHSSGSKAGADVEGASSSDGDDATWQVVLLKPARLQMRAAVATPAEAGHVQQQVTMCLA